MVIQFDKLCLSVFFAGLLCMQDASGAAVAYLAANREIGYYDHDCASACARNGEKYCYLANANPRTFPTFFLGILGRRSADGGFRPLTSIPNGYRLSSRVEADCEKLVNLANVPPAERVAPQIVGLHPLRQEKLERCLREDAVNFKRIQELLEHNRVIKERAEWYRWWKTVEDRTMHEYPEQGLCGSCTTSDIV